MKIKLIVLFTLATLVAKAQDTIPELITDRPDQTESAAVVPLGALQLETGFIVEVDENEYFDLKNTTYNTTLLRYGLFENFELRMGLAYIEQEYTGYGTIIHSGLTPLYTGFKIKISEERGWMPEMAFLGSLTLPVTAADEYKPDNAAPAMRFAFAHTLSEHFSLGYNLGAEWSGESALPYYYYSMALGMSFGERTGMFVETYGYIPEGEEILPMLDAGLTYLLRHNLQFDISGGIGLKEDVPDYFVSAGLSLRIPR